MIKSQRLASAGGGSFGDLDDMEARSQRDAQARGDAIDKATGRVRRAAPVPLKDLVLNPFNPRRTISQESLEETAESLRTRGQIQPITVVTREAFLEAHPGQEEALGNARFVALDGNRRLRAARLAGLDSLRVDVNDDLAASDSNMLEAALIANIHREGVPPIEEAEAIQLLLTRVYGGKQAAVARALGKAPMWVSQRLALLHLTPELQEQVERKEVAVEDARKIGAATRAGKLAPEEQQSAVETAAAARKTARQTKAVPRQAPPENVNAVYATTTPAAAPESSEAGNVNGVYVPGPPLPDENVNAVYASGSAAGVPENVNGVYAGPPEQDPEAAVIVLSLDRRNLPVAAKALREALTKRESFELAEAIIDSLRESPEPATAG